MSRTAIVILNYNGEKLLPQFLPSVLQHSADAEIIVADNASTDQSIALLKKDFPGSGLFNWTIIMASAEAITGPYVRFTQTTTFC